MTAHELARRAVACKHWMWLPGMLALYPGGYKRIQDDDAATQIGDDWLPDLFDPATTGCLVALVRKSRSDCAVWVLRTGVVNRIDDTKSHMSGRVGCVVGGGPTEELIAVYGVERTEVEALVAALEAAP